MHNLILVFIDAYIGFSFKQSHPSLLSIHCCVTVNYKKISWQLFKRTLGRFIGFLHPYKHDHCSQVQVYVVFVLCVLMLMSSAGGGVRLSPAPTSPRVWELSCPLHLLWDKGAQCGTCILHLLPPCHTHTHTLSRSKSIIRTTPAMQTHKYHHYLEPKILILVYVLQLSLTIIKINIAVNILYAKILVLIQYKIIHI